MINLMISFLDPSKTQNYHFSSRLLKLPSSSLIAPLLLSDFNHEKVHFIFILFHVFSSLHQ